MDLDGDGIDEEQFGGAPNMIGQYAGTDSPEYFPPGLSQVFGRMPGGAVGGPGTGWPAHGGFPKTQFPPGQFNRLNRLPNPGQFGMGPGIPSQPDPRTMQEVQEKETTLQMLMGRDDLNDLQKAWVKKRIEGDLDRVDPQRQYRNGSPLRSMTGIEKASAQGARPVPGYPGLFEHLDPRTGGLKYFQYKQPPHPQEPFQPMPREQMEQQGLIQHFPDKGFSVIYDPKGVPHRMQHQQPKVERHPDEEARDKRIMHNFEVISKQTESKETRSEAGLVTSTTKPRYEMPDAMRMAHQMEALHQEETRKAKKRANLEAADEFEASLASQSRTPAQATAERGRQQAEQWRHRVPSNAPTQPPAIPPELSPPGVP